LQAVCLCGEAAGESYRPLRSPLSLVVVLAAVTPQALRATAGCVARWRRQRLAVPLLFDQAYIGSARDVFPLEFLDLRDRHHLLFGEDPFAGLEIDLAHLRIEVEEHLRGKLLHLYEAYLEAAGSRRSVRALLVDSAPGFEITLRGMLRLRGGERPPGAAQLLSVVEQAFGVALPVLRRLASVRAGEASIARDEVEWVFDSYVDEVRSLVGVVDTL
jgi:hypothetical protein